MSATAAPLTLEEVKVAAAALNPRERADLMDHLYLLSRPPAFEPPVAPEPPASFVRNPTAEEAIEHARLATAVYERLKREVLTDHDFGKYLVVEPVSGDYEFDASLSVASRLLRQRWPGRPTSGLRIGDPQATMRNPRPRPRSQRHG